MINAMLLMFHEKKITIQNKNLKLLQNLIKNFNI